MEHNFKIGDSIIIKDKPNFWNSELSPNCPLNANIQFPYKCIIENILNQSCIMIAMSAGGYGWSLNELINKNLIELNNSTINYEIY